MIPNLKDFIQGTDPANRALLALAMRDFEALRDRWLDEAAEFAANGNPRRAYYIESLAGGA